MLDNALIVSRIPPGSVATGITTTSSRHAERARCRYALSLLTSVIALDLAIWAGGVSDGADSGELVEVGVRCGCVCGGGGTLWMVVAFVT